MRLTPEDKEAAQQINALIKPADKEAAMSVLNKIRLGLRIRNGHYLARILSNYRSKDPYIIQNYDWYRSRYLKSMQTERVIDRLIWMTGMDWHDDTPDPEQVDISELPG